MRRPLLISAALLCLVLVGACGLAAFAWYSVSIREYPTCATYTFRLNAGRVDQFKRDAKEHMAALSLQVDGETRDGIGWSGKNAYVTLSANENSDSTVFVCAKERESNEWQSISRRMEPLLVKHGIIDAARIQLNPAIFECGHNVCAPVDVRAPIDFQAFNSGAMKLPPRK